MENDHRQTASNAAESASRPIAPRIALGLSAISFCFGALGMAGWIFDEPRWRSFLAMSSEMKSNAALGLMALGLALGLRVEKAVAPLIRTLSHLFAGLAGVIGALTLLEYGLDASFGLDEMLFRDVSTVGTSHPGRMSPPSALSFCLAALGILFLGYETRKGVRPAQWLGLATAFVPAYILLSYAYGNMSVLGFGSHRSYMAVPTAAAFISVAVGILLDAPRRGVMQTLTTRTPASRVLRWLLLACLLVPPALGWFVLTFLEGRQNPPEFSVSTTVMLCSVILAALAWFNTARLNRAEGALQQTEEELRDFVENASVAMHWVCADGIILWANKTELELLGYSREEYVGHPIAKFHADEPVIQDILGRLTKDEALNNYEARLCCKDGSIRHVLINSNVLRKNGKLVHTRCFTRDITERKAREEALRESKVRLDFTLEAARVGDWDLDLVTDCARRSLRHDQAFGYAEPVAEWGFEKFLAHVHPEDREEVARNFGCAVADQKEWHFECRVIWPDGGVHWIEAHGNVFRSEDGQPRNMLGIVSDITVRKNGEEALRAAKQDAEMANAAKDRFLAVLSHELRTPLTPVLMTVSAMEHDPELSAEVREDLAMMKRNIELETKLIDDLLDVTRITSGKLPLQIEPVDLNEAVGHVCKICRSELQGRTIRVQTLLGPDAGMVAADSARLQQVLWNVLRNAIKFTPDGGVVEVATARLSDERCEVRVRDSGIGIPPEVLPRIFQAFEQGESTITRKFGGLGLGLAICKGIVDLHGGSIRAESGGDGQGTTFFIELPAARAATPAKPEGCTADPQTATALRVLLVEDHADTGQVLSRLLRIAGYAITLARDVASARAAVQSATFDLVVSDLGLPDGSGLDVIREVRAHQSIPGIAMSGYGTEEDMRRSYEAGFSEHLVKPVNLDKLKAAIRRVGENRGGQTP